MNTQNRIADYFSFIVCVLVIVGMSCNQDKISDVGTPPIDEEELIVEDPTNGGNSMDTIHNINWKNWYLSVPIDAGNGKATSISHEAIINDDFTDEERKYFFQNEDESYTLWTKFTGYTTSGYSELGDKYCRTELREFWRGVQDTHDNWLMNSGVHLLETTMKVDFVEGNGRTIVAQIHGKESPELDILDSPATVKIRWNDGMIQIDHYTQPQNGDPWTSQYDEKKNFGRVDNEIFTFKMKIEDGKLFCGLVCEANELNIEFSEIYDYVGNGYYHENYFKTGNYFGWNDDYEKTAQVVLYRVATDHQ